jgi:hypothetical protein
MLMPAGVFAAAPKPIMATKTMIAIGFGANAAPILLIPKVKSSVLICFTLDEPGRKPRRANEEHGASTKYVPDPAKKQKSAAIGETKPFD